MCEMTTWQRMGRMYGHRPADRVPVTDVPWAQTIERWRAEGMPKDVAYADFFGLDKFVAIAADNSPRYPAEVVEETDEYVVSTTRWGQTVWHWKQMGGVPEFLECRITDPQSWAEAKARMKPSRDRIDWAKLKRQYKKWRAEGAWIAADFWFGFDVTHSWMVGTERLLMAMVEQPEWVVDMFNHFLDVDLALFEMVWEAGYRFDEIRWPDDMGYKNSTFFSPEMYRQLLKPVHKRAADWAHARGVKVQLHSCGYVYPLIPDLLEVGIDMLNPLEVKAGMDPLKLKRQYGEKLAFHGGLNAVLFDQPEALWQQMRQVIPVMKQGGGYCISSDHSVPQSVSLEQFRQFVRLAKELGSYE